MKPDYKTLSWLATPWLIKELLAWSLVDIATRAAQVHQVQAANQQVYQSAVVQHQRDREAFRAAHPRSALPSALERSVPRPPDLMERWQKLLKRREKALREIEEAELRRQERRESAERQRVARAEARKQAFVERMEDGRFEAMQRRESAIRKRLNELAREHGVVFTAWGIDARLDELLIALGLIDVPEHEAKTL